MAAPRRQRPKRSKRARRTIPGVPFMPKRGETITVTQRAVPDAHAYAPTPQTGYTPPDIHAVTTNQEPPATWPPVELPGQAGNDGMAVAPLPGENGQADPQTIYEPAGLDEVPYSDYNESPGVDYPGSL